jgi:hypothetical protein
MDSPRFDALVTSLSSAGTRRGITRLLAAMPLGVALTALLGDEQDTTAIDDDHGSSHRRQRRKARHTHDPGKSKKHKKKDRRRPTTQDPLPPLPPPSPSCSELCPRACGNCYTRVSGATMCGDNIEGTCVGSCQSDSDCTDDKPFCIISWTERTTGKTITPCPERACARISAC